MEPQTQEKPRLLRRIWSCYTTCRGRINRRTYLVNMFWLFGLYCLALVVAMIPVVISVGVATSDGRIPRTPSPFFLASYAIFFIACLASIPPSMKRCHDFGAGWPVLLAAYLFSLFTFGFPLLLLCIVPGQRTANEFGEPSRAETIL